MAPRRRRRHAAHRRRLRARARRQNAAGNVGYSSANTFTLDTSAPTTTINTRPSGPTNQTGASFGFRRPTSPAAASSAASTPPASAACTSPKSYSGLTDGPHSFQVKATDAAGNESAGHLQLDDRCDRPRAPSIDSTNPADPSELD